MTLRPSSYLNIFTYAKDGSREEFGTHSCALNSMLIRMYCEFAHFNNLKIFVHMPVPGFWASLPSSTYKAMQVFVHEGAGLCREQLYRLVNRYFQKFDHKKSPPTQEV